MQVKVEEAVYAETSNTAARIQQDLKKANLSYSQVYVPDPAKPQVIRVEGTATASSSTVQNLLDAKYSNEYNLDSVCGQCLDAHHEADGAGGSGEEDRPAGD